MSKVLLNAIPGFIRLLHCCYCCYSFIRAWLNRFQLSTSCCLVICIIWSVNITPYQQTDTVDTL